ncbi:MAG: Trk system potassium transporter TrkA [Oscillospiraceae bacterium]|jgi:trk system potassium uptake protein TrkA|nr:Trk system potassium transporter TrkA [Oscillospiraceae bacterium]
MDILIVGSGKTGFALAKELSKQNHNICVVDLRQDVLESSSNMLDVNCINGSGINMGTLKEAGAQTADLIIATTGNDELNVIICVIAKGLGTSNSVARIRNPEYLDEVELFKKALVLDRVLNPELEAASEISRLLSLPVANKVDAFANERVEIVEYTVEKGDLLVGRPLSKLSFPANVLLCGAERKGELIITKGDYICEVGDNIYLAGTLVGLNNFFKIIGHTSHKAKNIMIIGGSRMAVYLARMARRMGINVRMIERNPIRCEALAKSLDDCLIICGDGTEEEMLLSEDLEKMDAFIALTDSDEENLLSSLYAKKRGVPKAIPKINRQNYLELAAELGIESIISPRYVACDHILRYVQALRNTTSSAMQKLYSLANGKAEAVEFTVPGNSKATGKPLEHLKFKPDLLIATLVHGKDVIIPTGKQVMRPGDQVLIFSKKVVLHEFDDILL